MGSQHVKSCGIGEIGEFAAPQELRHALIDQAGEGAVGLAGIRVEQGTTLVRREALMCDARGLGQGTIVSRRRQ
jgi:hypothetical protein